MDYLHYRFEDTPALVSAFDEAPLWSASFGLLLLKHVQLRPDITAIDIGCGAGFPLFELAGRSGQSCTFYGIDPWENAIARAKEKRQSYGYTNVELFTSSAEQIPLGDSSVDLAVSNLGINNFEKPGAVFAECARILKPGGKLALTTNINGHWKLFYDLFETALLQINKRDYIPQLSAQQTHRGSIDSLTQLFSGAGLRVTKVIEENLEMKFAGGTAFLKHHFVKLGWLSSWLEIFPEEERREVFTALEETLNTHAQAANGLHLNVPMVFMEGEK
jgi:ubiquinone/menaquinone biosynthesis C-methylase UbiE